MNDFYASYNQETGRITGMRYVGDTYSTPTPEPFIRITAEQHAAFFASGQRMTVVNEALVPLVENREEVAAAKRAAINAKRDQLEAATPFMFQGRPFDYDNLSRERLKGAKDAARRMKEKGAPETAIAATWALYDNTTWDMTIGDLLDFGLAEAERSGPLHATARTLKQAVDVALAGGATAEEIDALPVWE